jgi:hypothetical protein
MSSFRKHGANFVKCIWIRRTEGAKNTQARFDAAFQGVPIGKFRLFDDPKELEAIDIARGQC